MDKIISISEIEKLIKDNTMLLIYFSGNYCGVCQAVKPKVEELIKNYPNIKLIEINTTKSNEISAHFSIFSIPSVIFYIEGKEVFRKSRYFSIYELEEFISKYYNLYYS